ncbi:MAG TPA: hypothetical protein ENJ33_01505 [Thiothrix sp.]|nr:hypothetical protein [Thiothrix sp.]
MQLSQIKADIRLRSPWEAIDLGFAMVQAWWRIIYSPWIIFAIIFAIILWQVVPDDSRWIAALIFWWCKPVYDRLLLHISSQELFSLDEEARQAGWQGSLQRLKKLPSLLRRNGLFSSLTYRRLSLSRGFNLPIWQLEGLKGAARKKRQRLLHTNTHSQAVWLTIACIHIEMILNLAFFGLVLLWLPSHMQSSFFTDFFLEQASTDSNYWVDLLGYVFYVTSVIVIEPFYVVGSFGLYLNRRTQLEAWDIELVFRHMATRLAALREGIIFEESASSTSHPLVSLLSAFVLVAVFSVTTNQKVYAANEPVAATVLPAEQSKATIEALMKTKALSHTETFSYWKPKDWDTTTPDDVDPSAMGEFFEALGKILAVVFEFGLWVLLAIVIFVLIIYRDYWLAFFQGGVQRAEKKAKPDILFGMDIRPESLPDNIAAVARQFWQQGQQREALSLLYRGGLMRLVNQDEVELEDSHTEGDVIKLSRRVLHKQREAYLEKLTHVWQRAAYAHRFPDDSEAEYLFQHWENAFPAHVEGDI